ncbi:Maf-like protein [Pandoraea pneumonica]|uniref:Maf-like protein n=1 Tax=Pandoraea pneumonica TaxID=2508299 RepID=UPI003CF0F989
MTAQPLPPLILASGSRYRRELLERLRLPFTVVVPNIDETPAPGETPHDTSLRLSREKAQAVAALHPDALIIGSDQVATFEGRQIGKPGNFENAMAQLRDMRGKVVEFHSALCLYDARNNHSQSTDVVTRVKFRDLPDNVLAAYLHAETPYDCAGSAKSEGLGIMLLETIENDDPTALIGLPMIALTTMLMQAGISIAASLETQQGAPGAAA